MAERPVEIVSVDGERIDLRVLGACTDCGGCNGRCNLFREVSADGALQLPRTAFPRAPRPGEHWRLALADDELLQQSLRGYGAALAGLLLGAAAGHAAARAMEVSPDLLTAASALAGTLLAIRVSKRRGAEGLRLFEVMPDR